MIHLEYQNDQMNEHDVWESLRRGELTRDEVQEFKDEFESLVADIKMEAQSLEDNFDDAIRELEAGIPTCDECGEDLDPDDDEVCEGYCGDCKPEDLEL